MDILLFLFTRTIRTRTELGICRPNPDFAGFSLQKNEKLQAKSQKNQFWPANRAIGSKTGFTDAKSLFPTKTCR